MCLANSFTVLHFPLNSAADLQIKEKRSEISFILSECFLFKALEGVKKSPSVFLQLNHQYVPMQMNNL